MCLFEVDSLGRKIQISAKKTGASIWQLLSRRAKTFALSKHASQHLRDHSAFDFLANFVHNAGFGLLNGPAVTHLTGRKLKLRVWGPPIHHHRRKISLFWLFAVIRKGLFFVRCHCHFRSHTTTFLSTQFSPSSKPNGVAWRFRKRGRYAVAKYSLDNRAIHNCYFRSTKYIWCWI